MKLLNALSTLVSFAMITGCATAQLDNLRKSPDQPGMLVVEPISFVFGSSAIMMSGVQAGLLPSYYVATKENENGTFYLGSGQCVLYKGKDQYGLMTGGVWLPKNSSNPARLFSIVGEPSATANSFEEAAALCWMPKPSNEAIGLTNADLLTPLIATPQALGIKPAGPNRTLTSTQAVGGAIGLGIAQAIADSAKGEYQILQIVEDPDALRRMSEAIILAWKVQAK